MASTFPLRAESMIKSTGIGGRSAPEGSGWEAEADEEGEAEEDWVLESLQPLRTRAKEEREIARILIGIGL